MGIAVEAGRGAVAHLDRVELIEDVDRGLADTLPGGLHHLDRVLLIHGRRPRGYVRDRVLAGVHPVGSADHQRDGLGLNFADPAMLPRFLLVGAVHEDVGELVALGLHLRGVGHVLPHRDLAGLEVRAPVRAADHALVRHPQQLELLRFDPSRQALAQPLRRLPGENPGLWLVGERVAGGLGDIPDVGRAHPDHLRAHDLARLRLLAPVQAPPRCGIGRVRRRESSGDRGEDLVPGLAFADLAAELLPLLVPGHIGRERLGHPALLEGGLMLFPDQQDVVKRPRPEPGGEPERVGPVVTGDQALDRTGELVVELVELRLPLPAGFLPRRHHRPPLGRPVARRATGLAPAR